MGQRSYTFDSLLELKDAGAVTADAAAQVDGADKIIDLGAARVDGVVVITVSAIDITTGDEAYVLKLQGSSSSSFASGIVNLAQIHMGDSSVTGASADTGTGVWELPFTNEQDGSTLQYIRMYTDVVGTTPSINYTAWIAKH